MESIVAMTMLHVQTPMDRMCVHVCQALAEMEVFVKVTTTAPFQIVLFCDKQLSLLFF